MGQRCFHFFLSPRVSAWPQKPQTLTASKTKYEKFGSKIEIFWGHEVLKLHFKSSKNSIS